MALKHFLFVTSNFYSNYYHGQHRSMLFFLAQLYDEGRQQLAGILVQRYSDSVLYFTQCRKHVPQKDTPYCNNVECPGDTSVPPESVCPLSH